MVKDMFDREIRAGDICVYPVRRGSQMWMATVHVQHVTDESGKRPTVYGVKQLGERPVTITSLDRVAIIGRKVVPSLTED